MAITAAQGLNRLTTWLKINQGRFREVRIRRRVDNGKWKISFWVDDVQVSFTAATLAELAAIEQALIDAGA